MFNATKHVVGKAFLRDINLADEEGVKLFSKGVVGLSAIFAFGNEEAEYRVKNGLTYSQKPLPDGSVQDLVYDAPQNYLEALRQMVAHRAVDGKIPPELKTEFASLTIGQTFRQTGDFFTVLEQFGNSVVTTQVQKCCACSIKEMRWTRQQRGRPRWPQRSAPPHRPPRWRSLHSRGGQGPWRPRMRPGTPCLLNCLHSCPCARPLRCRRRSPRLDGESSPSQRPPRI